MRFNRPIVMSVAGIDPCGGAGLLADAKAFEQHKVYGLGVTTAQTLQTENEFISIRWEKDEAIVEAISHLLAHYDVSAVKIGIVQSIHSLYKIVAAITASGKNIPMVLDPVIRSTTEFDFWRDGVDETLLSKILQMIELITPNYNEVMLLAAYADAKEAAKKIAHHCPVLLKGGHNEENPGVDYLFISKSLLKLEPSGRTIYPKHGSGCVLSASIAANLALGHDLIAACNYAKHYAERFLSSTHHLLGYHVS